ncbi:P-loop NTPase fold protein [Marinagarivorans algicola]|uniref:P-loop NTPase fold protein n=1 Tax=Marinagarivorans algicola TaxID=1513270 RepID=UPI0006B45927|nr:P-loop NTPase fold protein [Marinagarivorans algicola]
MVKRQCLIAKRWCDIVLYSLVAAAVVQLIAVPLGAALLAAIPVMAGLELTCFIALIIFMSLGAVKQFGLLRPSHIKPWQSIFWAHPPLWLAMVLGWITVTQPYPVVCYVMAFSGLFCIVMLAFGRRAKPAATGIAYASMAGGNITTWDTAKLLQWAKEELPLKQGDQLLFGRIKYVNAILNRLMTADSQVVRQPKSMALLGEYGSGKSSIINAVATHIKQQGWLVVNVDAWERDPATFDEQVLKLMLNELAAVTDVSGYMTVPDAYHKALQAQRGWWATLSHLLGDTQDAQKTLQSIFNLLAVLNKQMLVVIEDSDRGIDSDKPKRCQSAMALIDRLQKNPSSRIKVIMTGSPEIMSGDMRVIEYKETLATPASDFAEILNKLIQGPWNLHAANKIWPNGMPHFNAGDFPFGTPRDFKHVIRDVDALWRGQGRIDDNQIPGDLCGEIELKQLVLLSLLKEYDHSFFEFFKLLIEARDKGRARKFYNIECGRNIFTMSSFMCNQKSNSKNNDGKDGVENNEDEVSIFWNEITLNKRRDLERFINIIMTCGSHQIVSYAGRINYLNRFVERSSNTGDATDVDYGALLPDERLKDQEYLQAMAAIHQALVNGGELDAKDVKRFICSGPLSHYLYLKIAEYDSVDESKKLRPLSLDYFSRLASKIIQVMPTVKYSKNNLGHPAGQHLQKIIIYVFHEASKDIFFELLLKALAADCTAGACLLEKNMLENMNNSDKYIDDDLWGLYRVAFNNVRITPKVLEEIQGEDHWLFVRTLMEAIAVDNSCNSKNIIRILTHYKVNNKLSEHDFSAIKNCINLLEQLNKIEPMRLFDEDMFHNEKYAKYLGGDLKSVIKIRINRIKELNNLLNDTIPDV